MGRTVPSAGRALFVSGVIAFFVLLWMASVLGATFEIGPLAGLARNATPETRAKILRYSIYGIIFVVATLLVWGLAGRYFIKSVPENFAARIEVGKNRHLVTVAKQVWIMPFFTNRSQTTDFVC